MVAMIHYLLLSHEQKFGPHKFIFSRQYHKSLNQSFTCIFILWFLEICSLFIHHLSLMVLVVQVRLSTVEALGQMVGLITRAQLKASLSRLVPTILAL